MRRRFWHTAGRQVQSEYDAHDTRTRILMASIGMGLCALACIPTLQSRSLPAWMFGLLLGWMAIVGLLAPEIERAWARSQIWGSDRYWHNRCD